MDFCNLFVNNIFTGLTLLSQGMCSRWQLRWPTWRLFHSNRLSIEMLNSYFNCFCWNICFGRCALNILLDAGALGQPAQYFRNIWCAHLWIWLKQCRKSELLTTINAKSNVQSSIVITYECLSCVRSFRIACRDTLPELNIISENWPILQFVQWNTSCPFCVKLLLVKLIYVSEMHACCLAKLSIHTAWYGWITMHFF